jgi:hypothetical protein
MSNHEPKEQARCDCGAKTEWIWEPECEGWEDALCWLCNEQLRMKSKMATGGLVTPERAERFIELVVEQAPILGAGLVTRFRWPFPWLKPWLWPAWVVWRIARGRRQDRFRVPLPGVQRVKPWPEPSDPPGERS